MAVALATFAERSGLSLSDVAFLSGLEESTVSRLWRSEDWLERVKGKTLQALIAVLPGVAEHMVSDTLRQRRKQLLEGLGEVDLHVDLDAFRRLVRVEKMPEQLLANALDAALSVMGGDPQKAAAHLARFWGRPQDRALGLLWRSAAAGGVFVDPTPLVQTAVELVSRLGENTHSHHAMLGHATLSHHVVKSTGMLVFEPDDNGLSRRTVMSYRSTTIGRIIQSGDFDEAQRYIHLVRKSPLLGMVERWSFPTYNRDAPATTDFSLPGSVLLRNTASELLVDLRTENEAYFLYLVGAAVPSMLRSDPTLGLQAGEVRDAVRERSSEITTLAAKRSAIELLQHLPKSA
ncbi:hypothetical protein Srot_3006 [Segniliparus rotundus DSM 44985]|uniref:Uncharacterized protein n=1 Tax=Segniliparus rotundus (strain ATCC BAA-972 / CDC 1076 / CIP 108378 / DSM 44985 / JCM 13578) TaxID=640132 RepID=D6ZEF7_SEGRD|nr:hypothetical protein [Segniliparus rotundus]ADG99433.1 hypothetical protein Srot_3006 [Segniliparus rotundus DSM 44985]